MTDTPIKDISNLDFNNIKKGLKDYLKSQEEFIDYDFEGSGINVLIDLLAHNTHYNAFLAHLNLNETFLSTAQNRSTVVSHANLIGYIPQSRKCSVVIIDITVIADDSSPTVLTLPQYTKFSGKINNNEYTFLTTNSHSTPRTADGKFLFKSIIVKEGVLIKENYRSNSSEKYPHYELRSVDVDTNTIKVKVYENSNDDNFTEYHLYDNINDITSDSKVFFVKENPFGKYEIYFGDGYLGSPPSEGNLISVEYLSTSGSEANNITTISPLDSIKNHTNISVSLNDYITFDGRERESIESIKHNAPLNYGVQNRAVTASDYRNLLLKEFDIFNDISVWGGEDNDPPQYGKVFISCALLSGNTLRDNEKTKITEFLKNKNVGAISIELLDVENNYIDVECRFMYVPRETNNDLDNLETVVKNSIVNYNDDNLNSFSGIFRLSNLLNVIDRSDAGIKNNIVTTKLYKKLLPNPLVRQDYTLQYPTSIGNKNINVNLVKSSIFTINGQRLKLVDEINNNSNLRTLKFINPDTNEDIKSYKNIGTCNLSKGLIKLNQIKFDAGSNIKIYVEHNTYDISPRYNQIIQILPEDIRASGRLDSVAEYNINGVSSYQPFNKNLS